MSGTQLLDALPVGAIFLITVALAMLAAEIGFRLGRRHQRAPDAQDQVIGTMAGMTFGLLAFLLAILTGIAISRFDTRRELVISEANAIRATYQRAGFFAEPYRSEIRDLMREYVDVRISALQPGNLDVAVARSEAIHAELWGAAESALAETGSSDVVALFFESLNEVIDLHTSRVVVALSARIPTALWFGMLAGALLSMLLLGMSSGLDGQRNTLALLVTVLVFAAVLSLIVDLDRPREGLFQVNYQALFHLQSQLGR